MVRDGYPATIRAGGARITIHVSVERPRQPPARSVPGPKDENHSQFSVATPNSDSPSDAPSHTDRAYEKWLVRILLTLAFGLAFGIEGMTLVRSFVVDGGDDPETTQTTERRPVLREGTAPAPSVAPDVRVRRLRVQAGDREWTFTLVARPDSARDRPVTLSFDRLTSTNGTPFTSAPRRTWAPSDTASFAASWALPVGQRPDALTVTASVPAGPDSTTSVTRTLDVGHVPVRQ